MSNNFIAIDVETANADVASICQIGIVSFVNGVVADTWQSLLDPEDYFDSFNTEIHGIDEASVQGGPRFPDVAPTVRGLIQDRIVVSHMPFDRLALHRVLAKYQLAAINCTWLDSARVTRRAWPQFAVQGYGLASAADHCGISFRHHDAAEDARTAGLILLRAVVDTGLSVPEWLHRSHQPITPEESLARSGNAEGPLAGEVLVFTGALVMTRHDAADLAAKAGCDVVESVTKQTTMLVVGDQDTRRLAGFEKSTKHRKAETLIAKGVPMRILSEDDFSALVGLE